MPQFRSVDDHLRAVAELGQRYLASTTPTTEMCAVEQARGRVLATDIRARYPIPAFHNSAMDGFLVHYTDLTGDSTTLPVVADVPAGSAPRSPQPGEAVRIMTGAPIEVSGSVADTSLAVVPVEASDMPIGLSECPAEVCLQGTARAGQHIRAAGEDVHLEQTVLSAGTVVDAGVLATAISVGHSELEVYSVPTVAVLSTGDELRAPGEELGAGQIPDSNGPMLAALVAAAGADCIRVHCSSDTPAEFERTLGELSERADMIITSGGVSAGSFDVVKEVLSQHGVWFGAIAQQPGKPQGLGLVNSTLIACLPGNPVSVYASFHLYVAALIRLLRSRVHTPGQWDLPIVVATAGGHFPGDARRARFVPVCLERTGPVTATTVRAVPAHHRGLGSHLISSLAVADGLAIVPAGAGDRDDGDEIRVLCTRL
ncbi:Molybdopterin molybdenumtransferase [Corynebacterium ciconiae DSM 44920]|uniref:molybdopterin molybdotransferase MoeA n=1 Tax=Corynebacterium ciconiae TaxID=227319 RepID=UPI0003622625|nr:gephyrin-like molybdotransferase Glp [Corynebacterium ciconiae]WKD60974.1 Molybdopterin molybdenumtransferase [Corynebacterium ciconiae DSM 44920]